MKTIKLERYDIITDENLVLLTYSDESTVYVRKADFDRAFDAIVNATKEEVIRDFAV